MSALVRVYVNVVITEMGRPREEAIHFIPPYLTPGLSMVMLLAGARSSAQKAIAESLELAPLEYSKFGEWQLVLFQAAALMSLGIFKECEILMNHVIPGADSVEQRYYQFALSAFDIELKCFGLKLRAAGERAKRLLSLSRDSDQITSQWKYWVSLLVVLNQP